MSARSLRLLGFASVFVSLAAGPAWASHNTRCPTGTDGIPQFNGCTLFFTTTEGVNPPSQIFNLNTDGSHALSGTVNKSDAWILVDPPTWSTGPFSQVVFTVDIDVSGLAPGVHTGTAFGHNFSAGTAITDVEVTITEAVPEPDGFVEMAIFRADDALFPSTAFFVDFSVELDDPSVTDVTLATPGATFPLELADGSWENDFGFMSFGDLQSAIDGPFTVTVVGGALASTSTFGFDANELVDGDFYMASVVQNPQHGEMAVASDVTFQWTDPTGLDTPLFLEVEVEPDDGPGGQSDDSITGTLLVTDTSWQPPMALADGDYEFDVIYGNVDSSPFTSTLQVTSGSITWGGSPNAPLGYPAETPLLAIGADTVIGFTVPEPAAPLLGAAVLAVLGLLSRRRR